MLVFDGDLEVGKDDGHDKEVVDAEGLLDEVGSEVFEGGVCGRKGFEGAGAVGVEA